MVNVRKLSYFVQKFGYGYFTVKNYILVLAANSEVTLVFIPLARDKATYGVFLAFSCNPNTIAVDIDHDNFKTTDYILDETALDTELEIFVEILETQPLKLKFKNQTSVEQELKVTYGAVVLEDIRKRDEFLKVVERFL